MMGAIDRVFRSRRPSQERPLAAIIAGLWRNGEQGLEYDVPGFRDAWNSAGPNLTPAVAQVFGEASVVSPGVYRIYSSAGAFSSVSALTMGTAVIGKKYIVSFKIDSITTLGSGILVESVENPTFTTVGPKSFLVTAVNASLHIKRGSTCDIQISGLSAKEWTGQSLCALYQDAVGALPCYLPGQGQVDPPVGMLLDRRLGFALGPERITNTGFQTLDGWTAVRGSTATVSGGTVTVTTANPQDWGSVCTPIETEPGKTYIVKVLLTAGNGQNVQLLISESAVNHVNITNTGSARNATGYYSLVFKATKAVHYVWLGSSMNTASVGVSTWAMPSAREISANYATQTTTTSRPTLSARYNQLTGTESLATQSVTVVATAYTLTTAGPGSVTLSGAASGTYTAGSRMVTCTAGALTLTVLGSVTQADLRPANDGAGLPPYQRVVDPNTYDTTGFPLYLRFDGVDDWIQTANVDFSGVTAVLVMTAVRKLSDASRGIIVELGASGYGQPGSFNIEQAWFSPNWSSSYSGATGSSTVTEPGIAAPASAVVGSYADQGAPSIQLRYQGRARAPSTAAVGGGGFLNAPVYIGRRGGSSSAANMRLYGLLVRGGPAADNQVAAVGKRLNQQARIY